MGRMLKGLTVACCLAGSAAGEAAPVAASDSIPVTNIVLAGAYGNLAGKYLWKALFSLYLEVDRSPGDKHAIKMYAAGRDAAEKGWPKVEAFVDSRVSCGPEHEKYDCSDGDVANFKTAMDGIEYVQLKKDEHYAALCQKMSAAKSPERGRMFYLSVPPFAYAGLAKAIHNVCTPPSDDTFLRVAFEKPFGSDLASAEVLAAQLAEHLQEEQIYRVDHYLGKRGVQQVLGYRLATPAVDALLTNEHVASIKVIMTEKESCESRTNFYDEYGVVRDIHQNHLTEVLSLVGMDLAGVKNNDPAAALKAKADFLASFEGARLEHTVLGQYKGYVEHCQADRDNAEYTTNTPTFAAASLRVKKGKLAGVPILIVAGKQLEEREAYVEVQFKGLTHAPGEPSPPDHTGDKRASIEFHIQGGTPKRGPEIRVGTFVATHFLFQDRRDIHHKKAFDTNPGLGWSVVDPNKVSAEVAKWAGFIFVNGTDGKPDLPYDRLMSAMYHGEQDLFVGTDGLMEAWRLWDTLLSQAADAAPPFVYPSGATYREIIAQAAHANHRIHEDL